MTDEKIRDLTNHEEPFEVGELDDQDLDDVAGGGNTNCGCVIGCSTKEISA